MYTQPNRPHDTASSVRRCVLTRSIDRYQRFGMHCVRTRGTSNAWGSPKRRKCDDERQQVHEIVPVLICSVGSSSVGKHTMTEDTTCDECDACQKHDHRSFKNPTCKCADPYKTRETNMTHSYRSLIVCDETIHGTPLRCHTCREIRGHVCNEVRGSCSFVCQMHSHRVPTKGIN